MPDIPPVVTEYERAGHQNTSCVRQALVFELGHVYSLRDDLFQIPGEPGLAKHLPPSLKMPEIRVRVLCSFLCSSLVKYTAIIQSLRLR